jgi:hypothetical protein
LVHGSDGCKDDPVSRLSARGVRRGIGVSAGLGVEVGWIGSPGNSAGGGWVEIGAPLACQPPCWAVNVWAANVWAKPGINGWATGVAKAEQALNVSRDASNTRVNR